jgi:hypothetical protein
MPSPWQREDCLMVLGWMEVGGGLGWADERPNVPSAADWRRRNRLCSSIGQPRRRILGSAAWCLAATGAGRCRAPSPERFESGNINSVWQMDVNNNILSDEDNQNPDILTAYRHRSY